MSRACVINQINSSGSAESHFKFLTVRRGQADVEPYRPDQVWALTLCCGENPRWIASAATSNFAKSTRDGSPNELGSTHYASCTSRSGFAPVLFVWFLGSHAQSQKRLVTS